MEWYVVASFAVLILLLITGIPIPFVFFGVALFLIIFGGYSPNFLFPYAYTKLQSMIFVAFPLFIIAGGVIERGGIGDHLINMVNLFLGRVKGGLGMVMVVTCALFGAISGSSFACENVIGSIMLPKMKQAGYNENVSATLLASACMLGTFIPPSGTMLMFAWLTGQPVLACFLATVGPGIIAMIGFSAWTYWQCRNNKNIVIPEKLPLPRQVKRIGITTYHAIPALFFPIIVLGGIYGGFMTPTEAAAISVLYAVPVALLIYRKVNLRDICGIFVKGCTTAGVLGVMVFTVSMIGRIYIMEDLPAILLSVLNSVTESKAAILAIINIFLILLGMVMDDGSIMLLTTPILMPMMMSLGVDPVHFAAIMAVNLGLACVTPPCAPLLFLAARIGNTSLTHMLKPNMTIMVFVWVPLLLLVIYIPEISLWLPRLLLGYGG